MQAVSFGANVLTHLFERSIGPEQPGHGHVVALRLYGFLPHVIFRFSVQPRAGDHVLHATVRLELNLLSVL